MSERSVTLLEIHLGEARVQIGSKTFGFGTTGSSAEADEADEAMHESGEPSTTRSRGRQLAGAAAVLLGLLLLVAVAGVAWSRVRDTDLEAAEELDELP